jgi:hypothetical protein
MTHREVATQTATQSAHVPDFSASAATCPPAQAVAAAAGAPPVRRR